MKQVNATIAIYGLLAALLTFCAPACHATTWYVSTSGSDSNSGSSGSPFATIYKAVSVVQAGDTIDIDGNGDVYSLTDESSGEPVTVNASGTSSEPIAIQTTPGESRAVLNADNTWQGTGDGVDLNGDYIVFQNITVENANVDDLCIPNGSYDTVQNCEFEDGVWGGANIGSSASSGTLEHDTIADCSIHDNSTVNLNGDGANWGGGVGMNNCTDSVLSDNDVYDNWGEGVTDGAWDGYACSDNLIKGNTIYDNWSVELYLNCSEYATVCNNFVYADSNAPERGGYPAIGIAVDNENTAYLGEGGHIYNNVVIGGMECFRYANTYTYSGFYDGGLNGFDICNNDFYGGNLATVSIDDDSGNDEVFQNNVVWQTTDGTTIAYNGGGAGATISNNCWDGTGSNNMAGSDDVTFSNSNPGLVSPGSLTPSDWELTSGSSLDTAGANDSTLFTFDFNNNTRPSSASWSIGAFDAPSSGYSGYYRLINLNSGMSLSTNNSTTAGTTVIQDTDESGWWDQEWTMVADGSYYRIVNRSSGMALSNDGSGTPGTDIVQETSNSSDTSQQWSVVDEGGGYYNLVNRDSSMAANTNNSTTAGTDVIQYANNSGWWDEEFEFVSD